jgi:hypothetical protein
MRLLRRRVQTFEIQVHDMTLHISANPDLAEEARAAALSFWEQLQSYGLQHPAFTSSKRPIRVPQSAPEIVREMIASATAAGVGPMYTFRGAVADHVGRILARTSHDVTVASGGDYFIVARKRQKLTVHRTGSGAPLSLVVLPTREGLGVATTMGSGRRLAPGVDGLAVMARSCMLADAAAAGVQALVAKRDGLHGALAYLRGIPGVHGGLVVAGSSIGLAGGLEIAA